MIKYIISLFIKLFEDRFITILHLLLARNDIYIFTLIYTGADFRVNSS